MLEHSIRCFPRRSATPVVRLLCIPHAGGGSSAYRDWPRRLPEWAEVAALELPGRGRRRAEPLASSIEEMAEEAVRGLEALPHLPTAVFGHSMGACVALELAHRLCQRGQSSVHLFLSGKDAPSQGTGRHPVGIAALPDAALLEAVGERYGGIPPELAGEPDALEIALPSIRADFAALEAYLPAARAPLDSPVSAFAGLEDASVSEAGLRAWSEHSTGWFKVLRFEGGHFYLRESARPLLDAMTADLTGSLG